MSIDVLEECVASILKDEEYAKVEASIKENFFSGHVLKYRALQPRRS
jgi:hypothetical protein